MFLYHHFIFLNCINDYHILLIPYQINIKNNIYIFINLIITKFRLTLVLKDFDSMNCSYYYLH